MILRALLIIGTFTGVLVAGVPHYDVKLTIDSEAQLLRGRESIHFDQGVQGVARWDKQAGLQIQEQHFADGKVKVGETSVEATSSGHKRHVVDFQYTAKATRGFRWLTKEPGLFTAFYCAAWMVCASSPEQKATLRLEIVVSNPQLVAVGPGVQRKYWRDAEGQHWVFETPAPAQTYLWSFAVAPLKVSRSGEFEVYASTSVGDAAFRQTADAAKFFQEKTGANAIRYGYKQVFMPQAGLFGQEATGLALMTETALQNLQNGDVVLMAHELAHQWFGVSIAIRSWSDFWLNEGLAEYTSLLFLEHASGTARFESAITNLQTRFDGLKVSGKDRPLHFEGWTDSSDALGDVPYVKGALFLHRLRSQVGDELFWKSLAHYSQQNMGKLVDSHDLQKAFEEATKLDLEPLFRAEVYGK